MQGPLRTVLRFVVNIKYARLKVRKQNEAKFFAQFGFC